MSGTISNTFTQDFFTSRRNFNDGNTRIGELNRIWYDPNTNSLRIGDGVTPGGIQIGGSGTGNGFPVTVQDEGVILTPNVSVINFTGNGVSAVNTVGNIVTVDIIATGEQGPQGDPGLSITTAAVDYSGNLILTLSDTTTVDVGYVKGAPGDTGPRGFTGNVGPQGEKGDKGDTGSQGIQGNIGPQGLKGDKGDTGSTGSTGPKGDKGDTGNNGNNGNDGVGIDFVVVTSGNLIVTLSNTYVINAGNVVGPQGPQGNIGPQGEQGPQGNVGPAGADGTSVTILGHVTSNTDLPGWEYSYTGSNGDGYITDDGNLWVWTGSITGWIDAGPIRGPQGIPGTNGNDGAPGADGISIVTVDATSGNLLVTLSNTYVIDAGNVTGPRGADGFVGSNGADGISIVNATAETGNLIITLSNLATIDAGNVIGPQGPEGINGADGNNGLPGSDGAPGADGVSIINANIATGNLLVTLSNAYTIDAGSVSSFQIQTDWNQVNSSNVAYIKNKPDLSVYATVTQFNTLDANVGAYETWANLNLTTQSGQINELYANAAFQNTWLANLQANTYSNTNVASYLSSQGISAQLQSDWNQATVGNVTYIKNKPDLTVYATVSQLTSNVNTFTSNAALQATWLANLEANAGTQATSITNIQNQLSGGTVATANVAYYPNVTATTTSATFYPGLYSAQSGNLATYTNTGLTYNPGTNALSVGGNLSVTGVLQVRSIQETVANAGVSTGNVNITFTNGSIIYVPSLTGNLTANLQGVNIPSGTITSTTFWLNQGATAYTTTGCYINNVAQTINWQGGSLPLGNANKQDVVILTILNFAGGYKVLGQLVTFG